MNIVAAESLLDACVFEPARLPAAMEEAALLLNYDFFCLVHADLTHARFIASDRQREDVAAYFDGNWMERDYRVGAENRLPAGTLYLDHRAVRPEKRLTSAVYNEFYKPRDMANYAGIRFDIDGQEWFCSASRSEAKGAIDGLEARAFLRSAKAAMRVASLAGRLDSSRARGIVEALEATGAAAIVLDHVGRVSAVTSAAEALFDVGFGVRDGVLWASGEQDAVALEGVAATARSRLPHAPPLSFLLRGRGGGRPILCNVSRVSGIGLDELPGARLLLVLTDMGARNRVLASELCRLFDLTPAEADVAMQFAEGRPIPQIAARRMVAESTVREQMKSIYRKTGVSRQVDLVRLLERLQR